MCIYFIYTSDENNEERLRIMAVANLKKIDDKLKDMYQDKITAPAPQAFEDRSEVLLAQMNFIAMANKQALHLI